MTENLKVTYLMQIEYHSLPMVINVMENGKLTSLMERV